MSGRLTPTQLGEAGIPDDVFINPDTLPPVSCGEVTRDEQDVAASRGRKKNKLKAFLKKDKGRKNEPPKLSELGDALGKSHASSTSSKDDIRDVVPVQQQQQERDSKPSKLSSFRGFFATKPAEAATVGGTPELAGSAVQRRVPLRQSFREFFHDTPIVSPSQGGDDVVIATLKEPAASSTCTISVVMFVLFGIIEVLGIVLLVVGLTGNSRKAEHCMVIGPLFLLLGCFVMIGYVFFVLFWMDNPLPCLSDCMAKVNSKIGAVQDPYGLKRPETYANQRTSYHPGLRLPAYIPPASPNARETIPMGYLSTDGQAIDKLDDPPG